MDDCHPELILITASWFSVFDDLLCTLAGVEPVILATTNRFQLNETDARFTHLTVVTESSSIGHIKPESSLQISGMLAKTSSFTDNGISLIDVPTSKQTKAFSLLGRAVNVSDTTQDRVRISTDLRTGRLPRRHQRPDRR